MTKIPLTIYLPTALATAIKRTANAAGQSQSSWAVERLELALAMRVDPVAQLATNQLARLLVTAEEWIDQFPEGRRKDMRRNISERTEKFRQAARERIGQ